LLRRETLEENVHSRREDTRVNNDGRGARRNRPGSIGVDCRCCDTDVAALTPLAITMSDLAIDIQGITKRYSEHTAVRALSLQVPRGAVYGLLGPNGAGKTSTIRMILDIIAPDSGSISLFGKKHTDLGVLDRVGYLPEERGLYKKMKVRDVLKFLAELKGISGADAEVRISGWMERMSLKTADKDWGESKVDELSRGMQQKVQFIGTLLHDPELVILDEPFSGLDPINAQALKDTVVELKARGKTVIFSTHIMENAEKLCDAVCIIANGEKVLDGSVSDVKAAHAGRTVAVAFDGAPSAAVDAVLQNRELVTSMDVQNRFTEVELAPHATSGALLKQLMDAGASLQRFERVQPSLHRIFLEKVGATGIEAGMSGHG
jgi:ABC-2 type transport system ATP-binding protein